ncbi:MAG: phage tail tape measure protein, partial [Pseudomonadota bacterium]
MKLGELLFNIVANDLTGRAFSSVRDGLGRVEDSARRASERVGDVGRRVGRFGIGASASLAPVGLALRNTMNAAGDFEAAMNRAVAALQEGEGPADALATAARSMGRETQFSATQAAEAIELLAKNGLSSTQILRGGLSSSLTLAAAGGMDLASSADLATDAMLQFGMKAEDLAGV